MDKKKKEAKYRRLYTQIEDLMVKSDDPNARMATICAVLQHKMQNFFWTGFYLLNKGELVISTYQGPLACMQLEKNQGVCWSGINKAKSIIVPDVEQFPGHIACDSRSKSEIAVPVFDNNKEIIGVLDVDSCSYDTFDEIDAVELEKILDLIYT